MQCLGRGFVDGRHQIRRRRLLDHVPRSGDAVQFALLDLVMQPDRWLIDIDQAVVLTRKNGRAAFPFQLSRVAVTAANDAIYQ